MLEDQLPQKMQQLLAAQRTMANIVPFVASILFIPLTLWLIGSLTFISGVVSLLVAYVASRIILFIHALRLQRKFYGDDVETFINDMHLVMAYERGQLEAPQGNVRRLEITIVSRSETSKSTYKDAPIYEWIEAILGDGDPVRLEFDGVINLDHLQQNPYLPPGTIVIPPGLLYKKIQVDSQ